MASWLAYWCSSNAAGCTPGLLDPPCVWMQFATPAVRRTLAATCGSHRACLRRVVRHLIIIYRAGISIRLMPPLSLHRQALLLANDAAGAGPMAATVPGVHPQGGLAPVHRFRRVDEVHKGPYIVPPVGVGAADCNCVTCPDPSQHKLQPCSRALHPHRMSSVISGWHPTLMQPALCSEMLLAAVGSSPVAHVHPHVQPRLASICL